MRTYFYKVIVPGPDQKAPYSIYLSFNSNNKIYENQSIRSACQVMVLNEVDNPQAIMPLDYKKMGNVSSSPLVKVNVFLEKSMTVPTSAPTGKVLGSPVSSVEPSSLEKKRVKLITCRTGSSLSQICENILKIDTLKVDKDEWKIRRVTAIDRLLVDVRNAEVKN